MRRRSSQAVAHSWLVIVVLVYLVPILLMVVTSFRSPTDGGVFRDWSPFSFKAFIPYSPDLDGYRQLFAAGSQFPQALLNTLLVCAITLVVGTALNMLAGFAFAYFDFRGSGILFALLLITFMVPFEAIVIPILSIMQGLNLVDTLAAVILPTIANGFLVFMFRQFYRGIPTDLRQAAMIDGASLGTILWRIYVPLSRPLMVTSAIVLFIAQWQALFLPLVVLRSPSNWVLQLSLSSLQGTIQLPSWGPVLAAAVITLVIPLILVAPFMRYFKLSLLDGSTRG
jgi:ABC-type glycerol-3-phosphate transport system permease component